MTEVTVQEQLRELAFLYAQAVDRRDADALIGLFTKDGTVGGIDDRFSSFQGADELRLMIDMVGSSFIKTMHNVFNQTFVLSGADTASGETYCTASHIIADESGDWKLLDMAIRYHNSYACEAGRWKFSRRRLEVEWIETRPVQKFEPHMLSKDPGKII